MTRISTFEYDDEDEDEVDFINPVYNQFFHIAAIHATPGQRALPIATLDVTVRVKNALHRGGFFTIGDVVDASVSKLLEIPWFGRKGLYDLIQELWHKLVISPIQP